MSEWKEYKLGDVINLKRGYDLPSQVRKSGSIPIFSSSGITDFHIEPMAKGPGVITGRYGTVGQVFYSEGDYWPLNTTLYVQDFKGNSPKFIYYFLKAFDFEKYSDKSAVPGINRNDVHTEEVYIPRIDEQKSIASVLSSLDDKIDLLQRQNKTLEKLAEMLFRQWFVEEGEGLENRTLDELIVFDPREKVSSNIEYIFFDMKCLSDSSMAISDGIKRTVSSSSSFRNGDTLMAKITPCLENGKTGFVMNLEEADLARGSTEFIVMRAKEGVSPYFVYCLARYSDFRNTAILSMTGTSGRQRVQTAVLKNYEIKYSKDKMERFHNVCHPHFLKIKQNQSQIRALTRLRDTMLPKLMSGEVRMSEP